MVGDACDNCPMKPNNGQVDGDGDQVGDACDNCPMTGNVGQADTDMDGHGNDCDKCPMVADPGQEDTNINGIGDACDLGAPCASNEVCGSMFCAGGVCCNEACGSPCKACTMAEKADLSPNGTCGFRPAGTTAKSACVEGSVVSSLCDALGNVEPFVASECGAYACNGAICSVSCDASGGCSDTGFCDISATCQDKRPNGDACDAPEQCKSTYCGGGVCADKGPTGCDPDGHTLRLGDGSAKDCAPYACKNDACLLACGSIRDCVEPSVCDASGSCVASPPIDAGALSCALLSYRGGDGMGDRALLAIGLSAATLALRRRRYPRG